MLLPNTSLAAPAGIAIGCGTTAPPPAAAAFSNPVVIPVNAPIMTLATVALALLFPLPPFDDESIPVVVSHIAVDTTIDDALFEVAEDTVSA
jgi:hypothetical protein